ncbi:MAG: UvrD-helicase domain-containing protein [Clostridia bacterium]|nr:UvrD-helicase domain-containing protein [Clostridia bacterium]
MDKSLSSEKKYLASVITKIDNMEQEFENTSADIKNQIAEMRRRMWDDQMHGDYNAHDLFELTQITMTESAEVNRYYDFKKRLKMLEKMRTSPYFARLDFIEEGSKEEESIYIGYLSLIDGADVLVCDWRADISSMYYDSPLGKTFYKTQYGDINVDLTLRRQFKIKNSKLEFMFDSDIAIDDSVLQEELGKTADLKLKTIITTIQKEQNAIIRDLSGDLLLVQGVAGSGKTSIALHRLAYLLYKHRNSLNSGNIIIFSPNGVFSSYIADVLPELGEDKVVQTDFYDFFDRLLFPETAEDKLKKQKEAEIEGEDDDENGASERYKVDYVPTQDDMFFRNLTEQNEAVRKYPDRFASIKLKGSEEFSSFLEKYLEDHISNASFHDVKFIGEVVLSEKKLRKAFYEDFKGYSSEIRKNKILGKTLDFIENEVGFKERKLAEFVSKFRKQAANAAQQFSEDEINEEKLRFWAANIARLTEEINGMFSVDATDLYFNALREYSPEEYEKTVATRKTGHLNFEDMLCIVYISLLTGKIPQQFKMNQVVVDEAQDYPPIIYKILAKLCYGARFTILGDVNQALTPHLDSIAQIEKYIPAKNVRVFNLKKSYRSTVEINNFINQFKKDPIAAEYLDRHGDEPEFVKTDDLSISIADKLTALRKSGLFSNAVICRNEERAKEIYAMLKDKGVDAKYIKNNSVIVPGKTYVLPVYLTKGLEFDGVIIPDKNEFSDSSEEKQLLYVACSRALHKLTIFENN